MSVAISRCVKSWQGLYNLGNMQPNIQVLNVDIRGDRALTLRHDMYRGRPLAEDDAREVLRHLHQLWGFDVHLESYQQDELEKAL